VALIAGQRGAGDRLAVVGVGAGPLAVEVAAVLKVPPADGQVTEKDAAAPMAGKQAAEEGAAVPLAAVVAGEALLLDWAQRYASAFQVEVSPTVE
jgi:hypothetical protein